MFLFALSIVFIIAGYVLLLSSPESYDEAVKRAVLGIALTIVGGGAFVLSVLRRTRSR